MIFLWEKFQSTENVYILPTDQNYRFWSQNLLGHTFFLTQNFCGPNMFLTQNFVGLKIIFDPMFFLTPTFSLTQNVFGAKHFGPKFLLTNNFFLLKICFYSEFFRFEIYLDKVYLDPSFFWPKSFFDQKFFWTQNSLNPLFFFIQNFGVWRWCWPNLLSILMLVTWSIEMLMGLYFSYCDFSWLLPISSGYRGSSSSWEY